MARRTKANRKAEQRRRTTDGAKLREPGSGRLSRRKGAVAARRIEHEADVKAPALAARARHTGLPNDLLDLQDGGRANAGTVHGVMRLRAIAVERAAKVRLAPVELGPNMLTADQYTAADWYLNQRQDWLRAIGAPNSGGSPGSDNPDPAQHAEWCNQARRRFDAITLVLLRAGIGCQWAVDQIADQREVPEMHAHLLKRGLDAIHAEFLGG